MKYRTLFTITILACFNLSSLMSQATLTGPAQAGDSLTLKSIISEIIKNHPTIKGAEEALNAAEARIGMARTGYLPNIDAAVSYSNIGPVVSLSLPIGGVTRTFELYPPNNYSAAINYKQTIYDFGRTRQNIQIENENRDLTALSIEQVKQKMSQAAINNFYTLAFLQEAIVIKDQELTNLNNHLSFVDKKRSTGSATDFELLTIQVRITNAESQKVDLQTALKVQQAYLNALLGLPENSSPVVKKELESAMPAISQDSLLSYAYKNRDEVLMNRKKLSIAEMRYDIIKTLNRPYLGFMASGGAKNGYLPNLEVAKMNYVVGVGLSVPIFDANKTKYTLQQSKVAINSLSFEDETTRRSISSEVAQAEAYVTSASQKVKQFEMMLRQAEKAYSLADVSFKAGTITNLDLLDSSTAVAQARLQLLKARIDYAAGMYMLRAALGERLY
ncbi:MAG TPA: TolC family protein [Bacteroidales bacterium]|nr:TolC family protein [Bacteroidales bacterium]